MGILSKAIFQQITFHLKKPENFADSNKMIIFAVPLEIRYFHTHTHTQSHTRIGV